MFYSYQSSTIHNTSSFHHHECIPCLSIYFYFTLISFHIPLAINYLNYIWFYLYKVVMLQLSLPSTSIRYAIYHSVAACSTLSCLWHRFSPNPLLKQVSSHQIPRHLIVVRCIVQEVRHHKSSWRFHTAAHWPGLRFDAIRPRSRIQTQQGWHGQGWQLLTPAV